MFDITCIKSWWGRRHVLEETGRLKHKPRTGRPPHPAFATEEKKQEAIEFALNVPMGFHEADVMARVDIRSKNTLDEYTEEILSLVYPPLKHVRDDQEYVKLLIFGKLIPRMS